jgi:hypothetical protein
MFGFGTPFYPKRAALLLLGCSLVFFVPVPTLSAATVTLLWDPSPDTNVANYNIYYGGASGNYTNEISFGDVTSAVVSGLSDGATYFFAATSVDSSGDESDFSNEIFYSVPGPPVLLTSNLSNSTYAGLFSENTVQVRSSGAFKLSATARGQYSGVVRLGKSRYSFSGHFGAICSATNIIHRPWTNSLNLNFSIGNSTNAGKVFGNISDGVWTANLYAERAGPYYKTNPAPYPGSYTLVIPGGSTVSNSVGNGFSTARVGPAGTVGFTGVLADGATIAQSSAISPSGDCPVFVPLYSGKGLVTGWLTFTNEIDTALQGSLTWLKLPGANRALYSNGLATVCEVVGSPYKAVQSQLFIPTNAIVQSGAEGTTNTSTNGIISFHLSGSSGIFHGSIMDSSSGKPLNFKGVVLQNLDAGYGFILSTNQSFPVLVVP